MSFATIVVCVRKPGDSAALVGSLRKNCGLNADSFAGDFTILEQRGCSSIAEGYNRAMDLEDHDVQDWEICVFCHADVTLWAGRQLWDDMLRETQKAGVGFVGVAGASMLGGEAIWWQGPDGTLRGSVAHRKGSMTYTTSFGPYGDALVLDGVFLAVRAEVLRKLGPWSEDYGWHFYDLDMTLRAHLAGYTNVVVPLPLLHASVGEIKPAWNRSRALFLERHGDKLPINLNVTA